LRAEAWRGSGWCRVCGREACRLIVLHLPCPWCTVDVRIILCEDCARSLCAEIRSLIGADRGEGPC